MTSPRHNFKIGKYTLLEKLGAGGFGVVRKGVNDEDGSLVAIKVLDKTELQLHNMTQQVKREITLLTSLNHPNIVKGYEILSSPTKLFLVMEYVDGGDMHSALTAKHQFSEEEAQRHFSALISCLQYCHGQGIYHRDLKLENLLLTAEEELKVCDFGLASVREMNNTRNALCNTIVGTEEFSAPEILQSKPYSGDKADMWSAGILLYTMIAGCCPFQGRNPRELHQKIINCTYSFPSDFPQSPKAVIKELLVPKEKDRLSAADVLKQQWVKEGLRMVQGESQRRKAIRRAVNPRAGLLTPSAIPRSLSVLSKGSPRVKFRKSKMDKLEDASSEVSPSGIQDTASRFDDALSLLAKEQSINLLYLAIAKAKNPKFESLFEAMRNKKSGIDIRHRRYRLKTYANCFIGSEAVDWLCSFLICSRKEAVEVGQGLLESFVWHHVCREHKFEDEYYFYRFLEDEPVNALILNFKKVWSRGVIGSNPVDVAFNLLTQLSALCEKYQAFHDHRPVDVTAILRDDAYQDYLNAVCELQAVDIESVENDDQRISFLVNMHNLWWMQARIHLGDFDELDMNSVQTRARAFKFMIDGNALSLLEFEDCLFGPDRSDSIASTASSASSRGEFPLLSPRGNGGASVFTKLVSGRKTAQKIYQLLRPVEIDPLLHFVLSNSSPEQPTIRAIADKEFNHLYLQKAAAQYLDKVLEVDVNACMISYPKKVQQYRVSACLEDAAAFVEVVANMCTGLPVEGKLRSVQRDAENECSIVTVVKNESSYPYALACFAPSIGPPLASASVTETPWMA